MSIQYKIIFGYMVLIVAIIGMIIIMVRERNRVLVIETEAQTIHRVQHNGNIVQHHITILSTYGETALSWEEEDFANYHSLRLHIDSMLQAMHKGYEEFVSQSQIDSLRYLLSSKEEHLYQIMQLFHSQNSQEGMQFSHLPAEAQPRTVIRKKKGFTGFLGAKETLEIVPSASTILKTLNKELLSMQEERQESINAYTDSLRNHNKELNRKLRHLITTMNNQTERVLEAKECHLRESYNRSICVISWLIISAIILLVISYLIIQKDLREKARTRKRLEDTIQQNTALLEMRKNIILTISHDIRAPLNVIDGSADLAMDTREKKRRNIHLNNIRRVCKHVVHLLNNMLDVNRVNEAKEIRNDVPFDLHELLERTAAGFSHIINNKGILFNCDFKDTEVKLYGDADRIEQIIDNLLTNAVKFTETGTINFNVHYLNGLLVMEIVDTGVGMSEETLSRIFRPFERQTSATNADGFGLGLPITQGLVNLLDGTIEVTSLINCGSTFRVTLPMPETDEPLESEKHVPTHSTHLHHNVLVIDDDSMLQAVIKEMLERNGMACTTCTTVKEVVKAMREKDYDLLLTDILMPYTNGVELLTLLRNSSIGNSKTIPIVAMTARGEKEKDAFLNAGFTACIYKPFSSTELIGLLSTIERGCPDKKHDVDFSMMLCEVSDKIKLLCSFIDQSKKDVEELNSAIENCDRKKLRETVHRMLPMWELLHNEEMLFAYRSLLKDERASDTALKEYTQRIINHTDMLMAAAKNEIKRQTNETENTDS